MLSRLLARLAGRGSPSNTEPLAPDPKVPGSLGPGPAVLGSGATRSRRPQARARGSRNRPGFFRPRAPARGSRPVLSPEPRTAGPSLGPRSRLPKKKGPAPGFREGYRNLPLGPGRRGADLKSAILGPPNAPPTVLTATWRIAQAQIVSSEPWEGGGGRAESEMLLISWKNAPISQIKTPGLPDNKHR